MRKQLAILIIGVGSAGRHHYRNLVELGQTHISVFDADKNRLVGFPCAFSKWGELTLSNFDAVFICVPNHLHMKYAIPAAHAGCALFIEKPLAHRMSEARRLAAICARKRLITLVACNMRFHPCVAFIKKYLDSGKLGRIYGIYHEAGHYLPFWRKGTDYRANYAAKKSQGGGIILDGIHEFDLLFWLFGFPPVRESKFIFEKSGNLDIETEDNCVASFKFRSGALGSIRCDYLQKQYSRSVKIVGERGNVRWDFHENIVWFENDIGRRNLFSVRRYDTNSMYISEISYFLRSVIARKHTDNDVSRALGVLRYCVERR